MPLIHGPVIFGCDEVGEATVGVGRTGFGNVCDSEDADTELQIWKKDRKKLYIGPMFCIVVTTLKN